MEIELNYGRGGLLVKMPAGVEVDVIRKPPMPVIEDPRRAVQQALHKPVACSPLPELARQSNSACIAICDITRPVPNRLFLRPVIESLLAGGMQAKDICVLVATGLHRSNEGAELEELVGDPWVLDSVRVENHDARNDGQHVLLGRTATRGTVVRIDARFAEADLRIATGLVEPHFMAGYSGGRKVIAPGLAHAETITTFHSARFMGDQQARNCNLRGNPLHEEQLEIVRLLGGALAVNTVIDDQRRLALVNFGEIVSSHEQAVAFASKYCEVETSQHYDVVLTSAAGHPLDKTYYQTVKGMVGAMDILKPGGDLIIVSECAEGLGSPEYRRAQRRLVQQGSEVFLNQIFRKNHADIDEWQTQMQLKSQAVARVHLYSTGLPNEDWPVTGVARVNDVEATLAACLRDRPDASLAVIPEGPYVVPVCNDSHAPK